MKTAALIALGIGWGIMMPLLVSLSERLDGMPRPAACLAGEDNLMLSHYKSTVVTLTAPRADVINDLHSRNAPQRLIKVVSTSMSF